MNEHLQVLILPHVVSGVLVHRTCVVRAEMRNTHYHRLLVLRNQLCLSRVGLTTYARRQYIVNRRASAVLLDVHRLYIHCGRRVHRRAYRSQVARILTPFSAYQIQRCETQVRLFLTAREVHTHEADRLPVTYRTDLLYAGAVTAKRNLELIPGHLLCRTVA